MFEYTEV